VEPSYSRLSLFSRHNRNINIKTCKVVSPFSEHKADCCQCAWQGTCILVPLLPAALSSADKYIQNFKTKHTLNDVVMKILCNTLCTFAPRSELSLPDTFVPWNSRSQELSFPGTFAPLSENEVELLLLTQLHYRPTHLMLIEAAEIKGHQHAV